MITHDLEDRLESAIRHINTSIDIDPWAQSLAVESMRIRIAMLKTGQPDIIRCSDCKYFIEHRCRVFKSYDWRSVDDYCSYAERRIDEPDK